MPDTTTNRQSGMAAAIVLRSAGKIQALAGRRLSSTRPLTRTPRCWMVSPSSHCADERIVKLSLLLAGRLTLDFQDRLTNHVTFHDRIGDQPLASQLRTSRSCFVVSIAIAWNMVLLQCALCRRLDMDQ